MLPTSFSAAGGFLASSLRVILSATMLVLPVMVASLAAQNSASSAQAAPGYRSALRYQVTPNAVPPGLARTAPRNLTSERRATASRPGSERFVYDNGPINGTIDSWTINSGFVVSDSFTVGSGGATINAMAFGAWLDPGDVLQSVEVSITSSEFGGTTFSDQVVDFTQNDCSANQYGFNVCTETGTFGANVNLAAGTYWVNLSNAVVDTGDSAFWDENSGPSLASENSVGTIPSESFTLFSPLTPTQTILTVSPNPVTAGQVVSLTAMVTINGDPVRVGTVTFLSGTQILATVQAVGEFGPAVLQTRFGPGTYNITAQYNANDSFGSSTSNQVTLTVTGTEPTTSTLSAAPDHNNYDFNLSVFGSGFPPLAGSATLNNLTQGGMLLGTISVPGTGTLDFQPPQTYGGAVSAPIAVATGDFNGDGILDLAVLNQDGVSVFLGNSDGSFQFLQNIPTPGLGTPVQLVVGDFNGDGILDLIVTGNAAISFLFGEGNGTFEGPPPFLLDFNASGLAMGDFNNDGCPDLVLSGLSPETGTGIVAVFLNGISANGGCGGNFGEQQEFPAGVSGGAVAVGDFNGDGLLDVAVADAGGNQVVVLFGDGQGGFGAPQNYPIGTQPAGIVAADLNGDGFLDLAVTTPLDSMVSIFPGTANGIFQGPQNYPAGDGPSGISVANFAGSGPPDLAVASSNDGTVRALLNDGSGGFNQQLTFPSGATGPSGIAVADFNGDGFPDLVTANTGSNNISVLLGGTLSTGTLVNIAVPGVGNQTIQASFTPAGNVYAASTSNPVMVTGSGLPTTTSLTSSPNPSNVGQQVSFTATVRFSDGFASGVVLFQSNGAGIPECPMPVMLVNGVATCTTTSLPAGSDTILASFSDPQGVYASSSAMLTQTVQGGGGDFVILPLTPSSITVTQTYSNATDPFFTQAVQVKVHGLNNYNNTVTLSCSVSPPLSGGSCVVNSPSSGQVDGDLVTTLTLSAGSGTQIGNYMITVSGQDPTGLMHQVNQNLTIIQNGPGVTMCPGCGGNPIPVNFPGPPSSPVTPSCPLVNGTGLNGNQPLTMIGGVCTFTPATGTGPFTLVISGCQVARLHTHMPIYASLFFGLPGVVLLGSLTPASKRRRRLLQIVGTLLACGAILFALACGGYGQLTPTGNYQVLVQATGPDGTVYSAEVPVTVTPLQ